MAAMPAGRAAAEVVDAGLWKEFVYDKPTSLPIIFSGWSRSENADFGDYSIYLDIWYDDGTPVWGKCVAFRQGTHGWERAGGAFVPSKPVKKIQVFALARKGTGRAEFRDFRLERREGNGDVLNVVRRSLVPYDDTEEVLVDFFDGRTVKKIHAALPSARSVAPPPAGAKKFIVWTADSMRRVTPLTFPREDDLRSPPTISVEVARRESESGQILVSSAVGSGLENVRLVLPELRDAAGRSFAGNVKWERVGYIPRDSDGKNTPLAPPLEETWLPDPLLPAAPFKVRAGGTQGAWVTVTAAPDAKAGIYAGNIAVLAGDKELARVTLTVRVRDFSLPETFGLETAFTIMDTFVRSKYPDRFEEMWRQGIDIMLDHRLNPDDITRTKPPRIKDLLYARSRGMNRFNVLNLVPEPKNTNALWTCFVPSAETESEEFYAALRKRLDPYVAELRRHDLLKYAYLYGFDERGIEYYPGIDALWKKLKRDYPELPMMTTSQLFLDYSKGKTQLVTTDWYCPVEGHYDEATARKLRAAGKKVWWYTCGGPQYPYVNMGCTDYPQIDGRLLLGPLTYLYADGFLYWHVNFWLGDELNAVQDESDTYFPGWIEHRHGGGVSIYPGHDHILPGIRLANVRDGVEDYEWLQLVEKRLGRATAEGLCHELVTDLTHVVRDPSALRRVRAKAGDMIEGKTE